MCPSNTKIVSLDSIKFSAVLSANCALLVELLFTYWTSLSNSLGLSLRYLAGEMDMEEDLQNSTISKAEELAISYVLGKIFGSTFLGKSACVCSFPLEVLTYGLKSE